MAILFGIGTLFSLVILFDDSQSVIVLMAALFLYFAGFILTAFSVLFLLIGSSIVIWRVASDPKWRRQ